MGDPQLTLAEAEAVVPPNAMADALTREPVVFVALRSSWRGHAVGPRCLPVRLLTSPASQK